MATFYDGTCDEEYSREYKNKKCKSLKNKRKISELFNKHLTVFTVILFMMGFLFVVEIIGVIHFFILFLIVTTTVLLSYNFAVRKMKKEIFEFMAAALSKEDEVLFTKRTESQRKEIVVNPVFAHLIIFENENELRSEAIKILNKMEK